MFEPLHTLKGPQEAASRPSRDVWLSASAGTGKTQVLAARVLRLLLHGNDPESILCLTFTKAGASEMAERIHERLGLWVTARDIEIARDLQALGEGETREMIAYARTLFARLLDARGQGLRIQTIHAFCQSLLGSFPAEAELTPGFRLIEGREQAALHGGALSAMVEAAHADGRGGLIAALERLSLDPGEEAVRRMLARCAANPQAMEALGSDIGPQVRGWLGLDEQPVEETILTLVSDGVLDRAPILRIRDLNAEWGTGRGLERVAIIDAWLASSGEQRRDDLETLHTVWATAGKLRSVAKGWAPPGDEYPALIESQFARFAQLLELRVRETLAARVTDALTVGQDYARHYLEAKRNAGAVDFDDLIRSAATLLTTPGMGEWIRYKLDQRTDHVLIDEAQDTNARQWDIVKAIAEEFFAGLGAQDDAVRTLFTVGDYKQAIFGFQGTDPEEFEKAREYFDAIVANEETGRALDTPELSESFRSGPPVLELVDGVIAELGPEAFGIPQLPEAHVSGRGGSGSVVLWAPVRGTDADADGGGGDGDGEEGWLGEAQLRFAADLARKVKHWTTGGLRLRNRGDRPARPGDVLILVRNRGELARAIVSRLNEEHVPVAGVDRLQLAAPIAVKDLLAAIAFVLQPEDDLNLAALLVSPLIGWDQQRLYDRAKGRGGVPLWRHLGDARPAECREMLRIADLSTPYRFLEAVLSGPIGGRRKLLARLGEEARDPVEALLDAALAFERDNPPSLQLFLDWLTRGDVEVVRDPGKAGDAVRVMTVHGAKGLQAPIVVLADATRDFGKRPRTSLDWDTSIGKLTIFRPRKTERVGPIADLADHDDVRDLREHWRLLYVALTRAEEHLFIGGALTPRQTVNENVWHERVANALRSLGAAESADGELRHGRDGKLLKPDVAKPDAARWTGPLPSWTEGLAPVEARPPRPLAPSAAEAPDRVADPPPSEAMREAAETGRLLHALFERLPGVAPEQREAAAAAWLASAGGVADRERRARLVAQALAVIDHPEFADFFASDALAEAPVAGVVDGHVVAGIVDRLVVRDDAMLVVEFKTGRRIPVDAVSAPEAHLAQIAAYAAVLGGVFPRRSIKAALVYTSGPTLIPVPEELLDAYKPGYRDREQNLRVGG